MASTRGVHAVLIVAMAAALVGCGATSIFDREQCGRLGQRCCELQVEEYKFVEICEGGDLYCLNFPSEDFDTSDGGSFDGNSSSSGGGSGGGDGGQPLSLCLPLPDGCGEAGGVCCPLTGNKTNGSLRCQADNSICMAPQSDTIYGLLTYELYTQLGQDPQASLSGEVALSLWGTCQTFDPQQCGTPGSLCGASLAPPGPQCPEDARDCPDGYYCQVQEGQYEEFGLCAAIPEGCGELGAACCGAGNYSQGSYRTPFCWGADVFCAARADNVRQAKCMQLPRSPQDCGAAGGPCCPAAAGLITDKELPPLCQARRRRCCWREGSYCDVGGDVVVAPGESAGSCVENPANCGGIAKPCCVVNGRSGLLYTCDDGFFCPDAEEGAVSGGDGATTGGVLMAAAGAGDRVCQECTPLVPAKYQTVCGYGLDSGNNNEDEDYYCNADDYYCPGDYAPAPAPGPYSDSVQPGGAAAQAPALPPAVEELPPLGPPTPARAPASGPAQQPAPGPSPDLGIAELEAPPQPPTAAPPALAPAPAPTPSQPPAAAPSPAPVDALVPAPGPAPDNILPPLPGPAAAPSGPELQPAPAPQPASAQPPAAEPAMPAPSTAPAQPPSPLPTPSPSPSLGIAEEPASPAPAPAPSQTPAPSLAPAQQPAPPGSPPSPADEDWSSLDWIFEELQQAVEGKGGQEPAGAPRPTPAPAPAPTPSPGSEQGSEGDGAQDGGQEDGSGDGDGDGESNDSDESDGGEGDNGDEEGSSSSAGKGEEEDSSGQEEGSSGDEDDSSGQEEGSSGDEEDSSGKEGDSSSSSGSDQEDDSSGRRCSQRRLFAGKEMQDTTEDPPLHINDLPECLLLEVFRQLSKLPPVTAPEEEALYTRKLPFKTFDSPGEVHPGLRSYPFLAQVCRHWRQALEGPAALQLWEELVVDVGHELVTAVHVPVAWSDVRPSDEEFRAAFAAVRLRSHRLVDFVRARRRVLRRLVLVNSEGYWAEDGEFVPVNSKHSVNLGTLGILLGVLADGLKELHIGHCNDLFASGSPLSTIAMLRGLRSLVLD
ncbi:expressed protein, partial [Chlorella variabilis]